MVKLEGLKQNYKTYGGMSCIKIGLTIDDTDYLVKYPGNLKAKKMKNVILSYSNSPVCEYLGSHIYEIFGIDVHETNLAQLDNKVVVMCKDFLTEIDRIAEFRELKATYAPAFVTLDGDISDGTGSDLEEALLVIRNHPVAKAVGGLEEHFWKMFIIDAFIGNSDRNNGNWGIIVRRGKEPLRIAPVYDNGCCLNDKWDDGKMQNYLETEKSIQIAAWKGRICFYTTNGKKINPFHVIESHKYQVCDNVLTEILKTDFSKVYELIDNCNVLSDVQHEFYNKILHERERKLREIGEGILQSSARSATQDIGVF